MKFSFDEFHIWYQFALSLISSEKVSGFVSDLCFQDWCAQNPAMYRIRLSCLCCMLSCYVAVFKSLPSIKGVLAYGREKRRGANTSC